MKEAGRRTHTDGDGVVPSKVIPDVVILELLHRFASAGPRDIPSDMNTFNSNSLGGENEERRRR